jgi:hypothetical protein
VRGSPQGPAGRRRARAAAEAQGNGPTGRHEAVREAGGRAGGRAGVGPGQGTNDSRARKCTHGRTHGRTDARTHARTSFPPLFLFRPATLSLCLSLSPGQVSARGHEVDLDAERAQGGVEAEREPGVAEAPALRLHLQQGVVTAVIAVHGGDVTACMEGDATACMEGT